MPDIHLLEHIARECGLLFQRRRKQHVDAQDKDEQLGAHFSTNADTESQQLGIELLAAQHPRETVVAEEQENQMRIPLECTVFDPLDGTFDYYNHAREYGVTLCTLREGQPQLGVLYWPEDDVLISAVREEGCWRGGFHIGQRLTIPPWHGKRDKMLVATDIGPWTNHRVLRSVAEKHNVVSYMAGIYGARIIVEGSAAFYYSLNIAKIWDCAAGALAVQEAGGVALSPTGQPLTWNSLRMDWLFARDEEMAEYALQHLAKA